MKVARMQGRRMHAPQRDRVAGIVNGDDCIALGIVLIADGSSQSRESDEVLARIEVIDRDLPDMTRRRWRQALNDLYAPRGASIETFGWKKYYFTDLKFVLGHRNRLRFPRQFAFDQRVSVRA
jgi:hypothetical protein